MSKKNDQEGHDEVLKGVGKFIGKMYLIGGMPLVVVAIGFAIIVIPFDTDPAFIKYYFSIILVLVGVISWVVVLFVVTYKWRTHTKFIADQDMVALKAACDIILHYKSDVSEGKINDLKSAVKEMKIGNIQPSSKPSNY